MKLNLRNAALAAISTAVTFGALAQDEGQKLFVDARVYAGGKLVANPKVATTAGKSFAVVLDGQPAIKLTCTPTVDASKDLVTQDCEAEHSETLGQEVRKKKFKVKLRTSFNEAAVFSTDEASNTADLKLELTTTKL
jgi:hypothetical protein